jgi:hypothetical protein
MSLTFTDRVSLTFWFSAGGFLDAVVSYACLGLCNMLNWKAKTFIGIIYFGF